MVGVCVSLDRRWWVFQFTGGGGYFSLQVVVCVSVYRQWFVFQLTGGGLCFSLQVGWVRFR